MSIAAWVGYAGVGLAADWASELTWGQGVYPAVTLPAHRESRLCGLKATLPMPGPGLSDRPAGPRSEDAYPAYLATHTKSPAAK